MQQQIESRTSQNEDADGEQQAFILMTQSNDASDLCWRSFDCEIRLTIVNISINNVLYRRLAVVSSTN
jgi:hypothetical protein